MKFSTKLNFVAAASLLVPVSGNDICESVQILFGGARQITFPRDMTLNVERQHQHGKPVYSNDEFSLAWMEQEGCQTVSVSGSANHPGATTSYDLQSELWDGKPMYLSDDD